MSDHTATDPYIEDQFSYLNGLTARGIRTGLSQMRRALGRVGNPERKVPTVIVGGTNGKGSVTAMIGNIVRHAEYSVGCYYSPHVLCVCERIVLNGRVISRVDMAHLIHSVREQVEPDLGLTYFEFLTLLAYVLFAQQNVDLAVMEVGMGGRYDATNVSTPLVSVITTVSLDHTGYLGNSEGEIAQEKTQIVPDGGTLVVGRVSDSVRDILEGHAREKAAKAFFTGDSFGGVPAGGQEHAGATIMRYRGIEMKLDDLVVSLDGAHQIDNAAVALAAIEALAKKQFTIPERAIREGLSSVRLPGRMERIAEDPELIIDVAHNPAAARVLADYIGGLPRKKTAIVVGIMKDKDTVGFLRELDGIADTIVLTAPHVDRAATVSELERAAVSLTTPIRSYEVVSAALTASQRLVGKKGRVVVTGSFYTVEEAMRAMSGTV